MKYIEKPCGNFDTILEISKDCNISPLLSRLLTIRGIDNPTAVKKFLYGKFSDFSSPFLFPNMKEVVNRINKAIYNKEKILIYGDYDCDGVGAIAIFYLAMREHGINVDYYIPIRATDGYGLSINAISYIKDTFAPDLIITVDCGINSIDEVAFAKDNNIDIIITDHHQPSNILPNCLIINPFCTEGITPFCGAGVAFNIIYALFGENTAIKYLDICALSTIADIVPLINDNRLIVKYGLEIIRKGRCRPGIKELIYFSKIDLQTITTQEISYKVVPKINASGRLRSATLALSLLIENDATALRLIAEELCELNTKRQSMDNEIYNDAIKLLENYDFSRYKLIMIKGKWAEGVVGIVCARLTEYFNLPTILLCENEENDVLKGSARSIKGIDLFELFDKNSEKLISYGGHAMAAGISLKTSDLDFVREQMNGYIQKLISSDDFFEKNLYYDAILPISNVNASTLSEISLLEPFGHKNPSPIFLDENTQGINYKRIGKSQHVKAKTKIGDVIAFDKFKSLDILRDSSYSTLYTIDKNFFKGIVSNQIIVKEIGFNDINLKDTDLLENFCKTFIKNTDIQCKKITEKYTESPTLYVTYSERTAGELFNKFKNNFIIFSSQYCSIIETLAVGVDSSFPFAFYPKIVFCEKVGSGIKNLLTNKGIKFIEKDEKIKLPPIELDKLRELFVVLSKKTFINYKYVSIKSLYYDFYDDFAPLGFDLGKFIVGCYVLMELDLLKIDNNDIISITNKKVNIFSSELLKYIG